MRPLRRLGVGPDLVEVDELAVEFGFLLGPQLLHGERALAQQLEAGVVLGAVVLHLLHVPAATHGEDEAPTRQLVEARHRLGGDDRIVLRDQADAGTELELLGGSGRKGQRHERIVRMLVALGQLAPARKRRAPADGDVGVLAYEQRFKAALLERTRQLGDVDAVVGREVVDANLHDASSTYAPSRSRWRPGSHAVLLNS